MVTEGGIKSSFVSNTYYADPYLNLLVVIPNYSAQSCIWGFGSLDHPCRPKHGIYDNYKFPETKNTRYHLLDFSGNELKVE